MIRYKRKNRKYNLIVAKHLSLNLTYVKTYCECLQVHRGCGVVDHLQASAKVILSRLPIGDLATQYFADRGIFSAGRVATDDLDRVSKATGAVVQTSVFGITDGVLGMCDNFEVSY